MMLGTKSPPKRGNWCCGQRGSGIARPAGTGLSGNRFQNHQRGRTARAGRPSRPPKPLRPVAVWVELSTADLPRARTSYAELSGWRIVDIPVSAGHPGQTAGQAGYSVAAKNDVAVAGITSRRPGARVIIADWATYLAVDNVDEAVRRVGEYGGTATMEPVDAIDTARIATILDPTGARSSRARPLLVT